MNQKAWELETLYIASGQKGLPGLKSWLTLTYIWGHSDLSSKTLKHEQGLGAINGIADNTVWSLIAPSLLADVACARCLFKNTAVLIKYMWLNYLFVY